MVAKPRQETIKRVIDYLRDNGLSVYGENIDLDTYQEYGGCRDYNAEEIPKYIIAFKNAWRDE